MSGVPIPTVSQVRAWDLEALARQGSYWTQQASRFKTELDAAHTAVGNSVDYLVGKFGTGARDKGLVVRDQGYKAADALEAAGERITTGIEPVRFAKTTVTDLLTTITSGGYLWGEDGSVTLSLSQLANAMADKDRDAAVIKLAALQRQADQYATALKAALAAAGVAAQSVADGVNEAMAELPNAGEGAENPAVNAVTGERLGEQVSKGGEIPPEVLAQIDQVFDQTSLSDAEKAALQAGDAVVVPASTLEFTQKFLDSAGPDGFTRLSEQLNAQGPDGQAKAQALANSVMLLSNENVKGVKADGKQIEGGYEQLPQEYRDILSSRVVEPGVEVPGVGNDGNTTRYPDPNGLGQYRAGTEFTNNLMGLTNALALADDEYVPGTKLSTELYRQAGHTAWLIDDVPNQPNSDDVLGRSVTNLVDIASRNEEASAIVLTGDGTPDQLGAGYHRDSTVMPLLTYDWPDTEDAPINKVFSWIGTDAIPTDPSDPAQIAAAERAGKAAFGLTEVMSTINSGADGTNNYNDLLNINGTNDAIGQRNPELTQTLAKALMPYVGDFVQAGPELTGTHGFPGLDPVEATRVMTILDSDPRASMLINSAALAEAERYDRMFATQETSDPESGRNSLGRSSGQLRGLIEAGLNAEIADRNQDNRDDQAATNDLKNRYSAIYTGAEIILGAQGYPGAVVAATGELFKTDVINGIVNDQGEYVNQTPTPQFKGQPFTLVDAGNSNHRMYNMIDELIRQGRLDPATLPESERALGPDNNLLPYGKLTENNNPWLTNNGSNVLSKAMPGDHDPLTHYLRNAAEGANEPFAIVQTGRQDFFDGFTSVLVNGNYVPTDNHWIK
ncbi:hypothetical protein HLB23_03780 [Nocardia uniformis]|uniref:TPR repeat domain-containing protein n=1 Tax=Nocardia uniformis TaxID=53432 RepID=A0A849C7Q9_9NOCA|nr:hypothetical protein [Nocardia uniformis]NNH69001.1 hypothetical protein [Nocardia uniformis]